jgi:hypothetical protein
VRQVFTDLPSPDMVRDVIIGAVARLRPALDAQETRRAELTQALSQLECQIGNLVDAIANGDDAGRPRSGIADREQKAAQLRAQLADLNQIDHVAALGTTNLMEELDKDPGRVAGLDRRSPAAGSSDPRQAGGRALDLHAQGRGRDRLL